VAVVKILCTAARLQTNPDRNLPPAKTPHAFQIFLTSYLMLAPKIKKMVKAWSFWKLKFGITNAGCFA
jgi:hypothetical protein